MSDVPVIDYQILKTLKDYSSVDEDLVQILVQDYKTTYPHILNQLGQSVLRKDLRAFCDHAHGLKSISATLGMTRVRNLCESFEDSQSITDQVKSQLEQLSIEINQALFELSNPKSS